MQTAVTASNPRSLRILRIDASGRVDGSVTRQLLDELQQGLGDRVADLSVSRRDLATGLPFVDAAWIGANLTDPDARGAAQQQALAASDALVAEVMAADVLLIGTPIYNFSVPASLKAWIDQIARARLTFRYTETGPQGLLIGKKAYVVVASGGTAVGSEIDFATPWLKCVLGFLGIHEVEFIAADQGMKRGVAARQAASQRIREVVESDWPALARAA